MPDFVGNYSAFMKTKAFAFASLFLVFIGAIALFLIVNNLNLSQDLRQQASISQGVVTISKSANSEQQKVDYTPALILDIETFDEAANAAININAIELSFKIYDNGTGINRVQLSSPLDSMYIAQGSEFLADENGVINVHTLLVPKEFGSTVSFASKTDFLNIFMTPIDSLGDISIEFDPANSFVTVANTNPPQDELTNVDPITIAITDYLNPPTVPETSPTPSPTPTPPDSPTGDRTCTNYAVCDNGTVVYGVYRNNCQLPACPSGEVPPQSGDTATDDPNSCVQPPACYYENPPCYLAPIAPGVEYCTTRDGTGGYSCTQEVFQCPDGTSVGRDPNNNCAFFDCPTGDSGSNQSSSCWYFLNPDDTECLEDASCTLSDVASYSTLTECQTQLADLFSCWRIDSQNTCYAATCNSQATEYWATEAGCADANSTSNQACSYSADFDQDGIVDITDFTILTNNFSPEVMVENNVADANCDGYVDIVDFSYLIDQFSSL